MFLCQRSTSGFYEADSLNPVPLLTSSADNVPPVIFLMGPTASGKTDIAAKLTTRFPAELISVDAAQVYRSMNIGTAKPDETFLRKYPHELINIRSPEDTYSAANFVEDAHICIRQCHARGKLPILVGGTLFYFNALEKGLSVLPPADPVLREEIEAELTVTGVAKMHQKLSEIDPLAARRIEKNDRQRIQRAWEIYRITERAPSKMMMGQKGLEYPVIKMTLFNTDRSYLHRRISLRFEAMLEQGLIKEVENILKENPKIVTSPSMRTVGYRQVIEYLQDKVSHQQMKENSEAATRQLAKRQLTWLRQQSGVTWFEAGHPKVDESVSSYLHCCQRLSLFRSDSTAGGVVSEASEGCKNVLI